MRLRMVTPPNNLRRHIGPHDLLRLDTAKDENLKAESRGMLHEDLHGLRRGYGQWLFVVAPDKHLFLVWDSELHNPNGANALAL